MKLCAPVTPGPNSYIKFKSHSANGRWYEWDMIARVIDETDDELILSLRPLLGTQNLPKVDLIVRVDGLITSVREPRRLPGGASGSSRD